MAEILSVNIGVDSDEENKPKKMSQPDTDSVSSDSDGGVGPLVKKKRATRTVRNRGAMLTNAGVKVPELTSQCSSIYSSQVRGTWEAMKSGKLTEKLEVNQNSDVEDESPLLGKKKETPTKRKNVRKKNDVEEHRCESLLLLSSDEDERLGDQDEVQITGEEANTSSAREPTPPPESPQKVNPKGGRRKKANQSKGMKSALKNLEMLKKVGSQLPDESDVSILYEEPPDTPEKKPMVVKIRSRSGIQRFEMKQEDSFFQIMKEMARHESVSLDRTVMFLNDITIQPYDSPASLNLHIADIIEFHIKKPGEVTEEDQSLKEDLYNDPNVVHLRVQGKDPKSRMMISIDKTDPLNKLMLEYALKQNLCFENLSFRFDGDRISGSNSPEELDMENNDCIDVVGC